MGPCSSTLQPEVQTTSLDEDDSLCLKSNFRPNEAMTNVAVWMAAPHITYLKKALELIKRTACTDSATCFGASSLI